MAFGKARKVKKLPNSSDILKHVSDIDIFEMYLGIIPRKPISSPFREDVNPSFSLFMSKEYGKVFFKDFATGESGDCFLFVMRLFQLSSKLETFTKIANDFNLTDYELNRGSFSTPPKKREVVKQVKSKKNLIRKKFRISVTVRPWNIRDKNYWEKKYGLSKAQLEYCKIYPISHFFVNGFCTIAKSLAYAFVEEKDQIQTFKIYQPEVEGVGKWINNNNYSTWELWTQLPLKGKTLIVTSSRKDAAVIKSLFPSKVITSCSLQSEGVKPKQSVVSELKSRFKNIFVMYDNDFNSKENRGRIAGERVALSTGFTQIEIPDGYQLKDPSDFMESKGKLVTRALINNLLNLK
ncbi:hypothetical protein [Clostridium sp.]|jgi:hypothetical protein|uniref:hypothetical protein n=1 Tax=Clostridium sp. TaxID=1506 RepID=UPI003EED68BC